jgi:hypothetical protein
MSRSGKSLDPPRGEALRPPRWRGASFWLEGPGPDLGKNSPFRERTPLGRDRSKTIDSCSRVRDGISSDGKCDLWPR